MVTTNALLAAVATPLGDDLACDRQLMLAHCRALLARGCDGLALFGTTGEGPSLATAERRAVLELLLAEGLHPDQLIVGTGAAALAEVVDLTRHASALGVARVLLMPPFFLRAAARQEGVFRFYAEVIERVGDPRLRLFLYHFPEISGAPIPAALVGRLRSAYGETIAGIKDSGGDWDNTKSYLEAVPELTIHTGTEVHARRNLAAGGAGTICGLANVLPSTLRAFLDAPDEAAAAPELAVVEAVDQLLTADAFLPACKAAIGIACGSDAWRRVLPPLLPLDDQANAGLAGALADLSTRLDHPIG